MKPENLEQTDSLNQTQEEVITEDVETELAADDTDNYSDDIEELRKKARLAEDYKKRAEIAEKRWKSLEGKKPKAEPSEQLSPKDFLALTENKVSADDFDEIIRMSKLIGKPVNEALKDSTIKNILAVRNEERKTALATQVKSSQRPSTKGSGEDLLVRAERTGEMPDSEDALRAIAEARLARKRVR